MFKSPLSRFTDDHEDKPDAKPAKAAPSDHDGDEGPDDVAKSVTVNAHHDGHYSVDDGDQTTEHPTMEEAMDAAAQAHGEPDGDEPDGDEGMMKEKVHSMHDIGKRK